MQLSRNKVYENSGNVDVINLVKHTGVRVLDIGCGSGSVARQLTSNGNIVDGITISQSELAEASKVLRNGYIFNLEEGLPSEIPADEYDYIICSHVLEHIAYPEKLLADIKRVLKNEGNFIVALPNVFYYKYRWQLLKGEFKVADAGIWDYTHLRWYSFNSAKQMLLKSGFAIDVATVTGELPFSSILKYVLPRSIRGMLYNVLTTISKGFFGYQLLYSVKNKK